MDVSSIRHSLLPKPSPALPIDGGRHGFAVGTSAAPIAVPDSSRGLRIGPGTGGELGADAREAGEKVESLFATMLVKELRKALPEEGFFGSGPGADVFNGWLDEFMGEQLARDGSLDLAGRVTTALEEREGETR